MVIFMKVLGEIANCFASCGCWYCLGKSNDDDLLSTMPKEFTFAILLGIYYGDMAFG